MQTSPSTQIGRGAEMAEISQAGTGPTVRDREVDRQEREILRRLLYISTITLALLAGVIHWFTGPRSGVYFDALVLCLTAMVAMLK